MSCGQIALENAGVVVDKYFASEINQDAIDVTLKNYPNTIHMGSVANVRYEDGLLIWGRPIVLHSSRVHIDLLIGGSPCQGFSQASSTKKGLDDSRSALFWEYVRIKNEVNPKWFLLENVRMDKYSMGVVTEAMGVEPVLIDSVQFVPQMRKRWYWTNIPILPKAHTNTYLDDILTSGYVDRQHSRCILESESRPNTDKRRLFRRYKRTGFGTIVFERKDMCPLYIRSFNQTELERLQGVPKGYTGSLSRNKAAGLLGNGWTVPVIGRRSVGY
jgi:DNA (cytosine-5)-methyltransferase 3A